MRGCVSMYDLLHDPHAQQMQASSRRARSPREPANASILAPAAGFRRCSMRSCRRGCACRSSARCARRARAPTCRSFRNPSGPTRSTQRARYANGSISNRVWLEADWHASRSALPVRVDKEEGMGARANIVACTSLTSFEIYAGNRHHAESASSGQLVSRAGTPTAVQPGGTSCVTTAPAPTLARSPMTMSPMMLEPDER